MMSVYARPLSKEVQSRWERAHSQAALGKPSRRSSTRHRPVRRARATAWGIARNPPRSTREHGPGFRWLHAPSGSRRHSPHASIPRVLDRPRPESRLDMRASTQSWESDRARGSDIEMAGSAPNSMSARVQHAGSIMPSRVRPSGRAIRPRVCVRGRPAGCARPSGRVCATVRPSERPSGRRMVCGHPTECARPSGRMCTAIRPSARGSERGAPAGHRRTSRSSPTLSQSPSRSPLVGSSRW
jgi:hypothetical protein